MSQNIPDWRLEHAKHVLDTGRISFSRAAWAAAWVFLAIAYRYVQPGNDYGVPLRRAHDALEGDRIAFTRAAWSAAWAFLAIATKYVEGNTPEEDR